MLVSNIGEGSLQFVEVDDAGKLKDLGRTKVGAAPSELLSYRFPPNEIVGQLPSTTSMELLPCFCPNASLAEK